MLVEKTNFSHAFISVYSKGLDRHLIYQATQAGVFFYSTQSFSTVSVEVKAFDIELTDEASKAMLRWCVDQLGKHYGVTQLLGMVLVRIAALFKVKIKNPFSNNSNNFICSELVIEALRAGGFMFASEDQDNIGLKEAHNLAERLTSNIL